MANPKVLIVEDDNVILSIEKCRLSNLGYDACGSAGTGADAMDCVAKMQPDIVLMDITLKKYMDGIETASQIKKNSTFPSFLSRHILMRKSSHVPRQLTPMVLSKKPLMMIP